MNRSLAQMILVVGTVLMLILCVVFSINHLPVATAVLAAVWLVGYCVLARLLRCPHCGKLPGRDGFFAQFCSRCGKKLE
jgi:hypothetical protein